MTQKPVKVKEQKLAPQQQSITLKITNLALKTPLRNKPQTTGMQKNV